MRRALVCIVVAAAGGSAAGEGGSVSISSSSSAGSCSAAPAPPRLILTTRGITTPDLRSTFAKMIGDVPCEDMCDAETPTIAVVVTAMLAPGLPPKASKRTQQQPNTQQQTIVVDTPSEYSADAVATAAASAAEEVVSEAGLPSARVVIVDCSRDSPERMEEVLRQASCTFVLGGNTFFLWHHMRKSGLDALVRRRVDEGMLYVGASAGSIVAGHSISTAYWKGWDDPHAADGADWTSPSATLALGLVKDKAFFPHHEAKFEELVERRRDDLGKAVTLVTLLEEDGAFVSGRARGAACTNAQRESEEPRGEVEALRVEQQQQQRHDQVGRSGADATLAAPAA